MSTSEKMISHQSFNPFLSIWSRPTKTLSFVLQNQPRKYINLLFVLGGIVKALDRALEKAGADSSFMELIFLPVILGAAFGWISYYLMAYFISIAGDWLKGKADTADYRTVLAWALLPSLLGALIFIPRWIIFYETAGPNAGEGQILNYIDAFLQFIQIILGIWTFVIFVKGVKVIQNFSTLRALLNILLPVIVVLGIIAFFAFIIGLGDVTFL